MSVSIVIDWKFVCALGFGIGLIILVSKIDQTEAKEAYTHTVDACKEVATASKAVA